MSATTPSLDIREIPDRKQLEELLRLRWSDMNIVIRGEFLRPEQVYALGAYSADRLHGIVTLRRDGKVLWLVALNSFTEVRGVGVALLDAALAHARAEGMAFVRAMLTNDNLGGLRFYQKRGFRIIAFHRGLVDVLRQIKPSIPATGLDGIAIRDELELEYEL